MNMEPHSKMYLQPKEECTEKNDRRFRIGSTITKSFGFSYFSILLYFIAAACFFYLCVKIMDAANIINEIQELIMLLVGVCTGFLGFFIFKKSFH
jgi:hypothetical protein